MLFFKKRDKQTLLKSLKEQNHKGQKQEQKKEILVRLKELGNVNPLDVLWMVGEPDVDLWEFAKAVFLASKDATPFLKPLLLKMKDAREAGRRQIAVLISKLQLPTLRSSLLRMIQSEDVDERMMAMEILTNHPNWQNYLEILKIALKDSRAKIRYGAVSLLSSMADKKRLFLILRRMCEDPAEIVRHKVLTTMARIDIPDVVEPFFERLPYESPVIQQEIINALIRLCGKQELQIEDYVFPALFDEEEMVRNAATELLRKMPNKTEILRKLLIYSQGVASWLRERCFEFVRKLGPELVEPLIELIDDPKEDIRVMAMLLAKEVRDERIIPALKKVLTNESQWWIRVSAINILSQFKKPQITELLLKFIDDPDLKWSVIVSLGKMEDPRMVSHLLENLSDSRRGIRMAILGALESLLTSYLLNDLGQIYEKDPDEGVRQKAFGLIQKLANQGDTQAARIVEARQERGRRFLEGQVQLEIEDLEMENPELNRPQELKLTLS